MFLSSHILSEVEAVCDRVGILRDGRLVEEGTLAELRHLSQHVVDVTFAAEPPAMPAAGGSDRSRTGEKALRFGVRGPVGPLVDALAGTGVVSLASREPSLEELFLAHYGRASTATGPVDEGAEAGSSATRFASSGCVWRSWRPSLALYAAAIVIGYRDTYPTTAERVRFAAAFGGNLRACACSTASLTTSRASPDTPSSGWWGCSRWSPQAGRSSPPSARFAARRMPVATS